MGIDANIWLPVNGAQVSVRILSTDPRLPVLLFLHGGPGFPNRHEVISACRPLLSSATLVCYDQRGAGKSYLYDGESLSLDLLCDDALAVARYLKEQFPDSPIVLVGHSFGSLLAILLLQRRPCPFSGLVACGLLTDVAENEMACYRFVSEEAVRRGDRKARKRLARIAPPLDGNYRTLSDMETVASCIRRYGGDRHAMGTGLITSAVIPLLRSREYTLSDLSKYRRGVYYSTVALWPEVTGLVLSETARCIPVPLLVTMGRFDRNTMPEIARVWYTAVDAPRKEWVVFEQSAHAPYLEEPALWCQTVKERMLDGMATPHAEQKENHKA